MLLAHARGDGWCRIEWFCKSGCGRLGCDPGDWVAARECIGRARRRSSVKEGAVGNMVTQDDSDEDKDSIYFRIKLCDHLLSGLMDRLYHPPSTRDPLLDRVTAFAYITSALTVHQGLFGAAIVFDVIHCQDRESCLKLHKSYTPVVLCVGTF